MNQERKTNKPNYVRVNVNSFALSVSLLMKDAYSAHELAEETGLHAVTCGRLLRTLHKYGVARIVAWEKNSRGADVTPVYKFKYSDFEDVPRQVQTRAEIAKRYRLKKQMEFITKLGAVDDNKNPTGNT